MKCFTYATKAVPYTSELYESYFADLKIGFFDIETTGLSPSNCRLILSGIAIYDEGEIRTYQYLAENTSEEPQVIKATLDLLDDLDMIITYNGARFDIPFLLKRAAADKIHMSSGLPYNLDLYQLVSRYSPLKGMLPDLKQKTVENYVGLWESRDDTISGKESVELYYIYAGTGDEKIRDVILLHNRDDIVQLSRLIKVISKCDLNRGLAGLGIPVSGDGYISRINLSSDRLVISGIQRKNVLDAVFYDYLNIDANVFFTGTDKTFSVEIPVIRKESLLLIDVDKIDCDRHLLYPSLVEGYLIASKDKEVNFRELNFFSREIVKMIYEKLDF